MSLPCLLTSSYKKRTALTAQKECNFSDLLWSITLAKYSRIFEDGNISFLYCFLKVNICIEKLIFWIDIIWTTSNGKYLNCLKLCFTYK